MDTVGGGPEEAPDNAGALGWDWLYYECERRPEPQGRAQTKTILQGTAPPFLFFYPGGLVSRRVGNVDESAGNCGLDGFLSFVTDAVQASAPGLGLEPSSWWLRVGMWVIG